MAYAEKRGNLWRARWNGPDGKLEQKSGFTDKKLAEQYGRDQEAAIRGNTYVDPRGGRLTLTEWANTWYEALDLEPTTMNNYRYMVEVHILPKFGNRVLTSLTPEEIASWERQLATEGLGKRSARDARSTLTTILADAVPRYIPSNPAARRKGKGRKGQYRIARIEMQQKTWASPLQALLIAERAAALSGSDTDFVMLVTVAYTGMRWSEVVGLPPECVRGDEIDIHWKLYELNGRFYVGRPKDGSMRTVDAPPFLRNLLRWYLDQHPPEVCTCRGGAPGDRVPWCAGSRYVFLGPKRGHARRSNYSERVIRPAADGWHPAREGASPRERMPVLVDMTGAWPGAPLPPWPPASPDVPGYHQPRGRGRKRLPEPMPLASWLPVLAGLTPHGLRHGHQTWMDECGVSYILQSDRMGHEVPGMRGVYGHISPAMREVLVTGLQGMWTKALEERKGLSPHSAVRVLDHLLAARSGY